MHDVDLATEFLHSVLPFSQLDPDALERLARKLEAAYYPQGQVIFKSNPPPGLAVIRKGAVRLIDENHRFLDKRSEGELFGHRIWFHGEQKDYVAEAEEDCLVWHLAQDAFEQACDGHPVLADYFRSHVRKRVSVAAEVLQPAKRLGDLVKRPAVRVESGTLIRESARTMSRENVSSLLVMREGRLAGIVTDRDMTKRVLAAGVDPGEAIDSIMTPDPEGLHMDAEVDSALLVMMRRNCRHLPVMDGEEPVGLLTAGDILRTQSEHPLRLVSDIYKRDSLDELLVLSRRLPSLFARMVRLGRDVEQIGRMVTHITDAFTVRLLQMAETELGAAPMRYAWIVFGSQAREEQTARTDQDNGLILERRAEGEDAEYFEKLSRFVCDGLDRLGYVYCPGEIMALNTKWRVSLQAWKRHFDRWIDEPDPKSVMHSSIFFDMRCVHGDMSLVEALQEYAIRRAKSNRIFRRFMAVNVLGHRPPIGFFRRFVQEDDGSHSEGLNLKHRGIVPIIDLVRMRALEAGIRDPNTFRRMRFAVEQGTMNEGDAESLRDALRLISRIRLEHQANQMSSGIEPTNFVPPDELSPLMRRNLKAAFMLVVEAQSALSVRYQVH